MMTPNIRKGCCICVLRSVLLSRWAFFFLLYISLCHLYTLIFLCKDIHLKISVILVRHTCILLEHNKFVHKDIRALSEIYKDDKMITNLFVERILFLLQGSINGKVCTLMHISFQFYFNYFSSLVLNIINWYTLLYSIYWILTRTPWHWKRDLCWNYWGHQQ